MDIITYLKPVLIVKRIFGYALLFFGLVALATGSWIFGMIFVVLGLNTVSTEGSQLNLTDRKFRTVKSVMGINFGTWKAFPEFEYVSVFKTKVSQTVRVVTASNTFKSDIILLNMFYKGNKHFTIYNTTEKADAFKIANQLQAALTIDILDATGDEKKWIEPEVA